MIFRLYQYLTAQDQILKIHRWKTRNEDTSLRETTCRANKLADSMEHAFVPYLYANLIAQEIHVPDLLSVR